MLELLESFAKKLDEPQSSVIRNSYLKVNEKGACSSPNYSKIMNINDYNLQFQNYLSLLNSSYDIQ